MAYQVGLNGNDTGGSYGSIIHGRPDPTQLMLATTNANPLYPRIDASSDKFQRAWKNLHVFTDRAFNHRPSGVGASDVDTMWYLQCLNGLYNNDIDKPFQLAERMQVYGTTEDDILAAEGPAQTNTILETGKSTTLNTGPLPIPGGTYYYLDFPSRDPDKMFTGGCSKVPQLPENFLCLWTMPYNPAIHRCTPLAMHFFYKEKMLKPEYDTDYGQKQNAVELVKAALNTCIVNLGLLSKMGYINPATLEAAVTAMKKETYQTAFADAWLNPLGTQQLLAEPSVLLNVASTLPNIEDIFIGGSAPPPTSLQAARQASRMGASSFGKAYRGAVDLLDETSTMSVSEILMRAQLTAAEDLCYFGNRANTFYTSRIAGKSLFSADSGMIFDRIAVGFQGLV